MPFFATDPKSEFCRVRPDGTNDRAIADLSIPI